VLSQLRNAQSYQFHLLEHKSSEIIYCVRSQQISKLVCSISCLLYNCVVRTRVVCAIVHYPADVSASVLYICAAILNKCMYMYDINILPQCNTRSPAVAGMADSWRQVRSTAASPFRTTGWTMAGTKTANLRREQVFEEAVIEDEVDSCSNRPGHGAVGSPT